MNNIELKGFTQLNEIYELDHQYDQEALSAIDLSLLITSKFQPRRDFNEEQLQELSDSIREQGVIQPIIVRKSNNNKYEIIAGERRWRAAKLAGLEKIPAVIKSISDDTAYTYAIIENIQRENLNPIEEAVAFARFRDENSMSHADIAKLVGKSRTAITNSLRLLNLTPEVMELLKSKKIDMGHARAVLPLDDQQQIEVINFVILQALSVRRTEELVSRYLNNTEIIEKKVASKYDDIETLRLQNDLSKILQAKVKVNLNEEGKGKVVISVDSSLDVENLISLLSK